MSYWLLPEPSQEGKQRERERANGVVLFLKEENDIEMWGKEIALYYFDFC